MSRRIFKKEGISFTAALPWILMGLCIAFRGVRRQKEKTAEDAENAESAEKTPARSYGTDGMRPGVAYLDLNPGCASPSACASGLAAARASKRRANKTGTAGEPPPFCLSKPNRILGSQFGKKKQVQKI